MKLNVLVACEESQRVCAEFRRLGHNAYSCDLQECSGGHPEWHIKGDCLDAADLIQKLTGANGGSLCYVTTQDGGRHFIPNNKWDLVIAHPPCTYLAQSGWKYCNISNYGSYAEKRLREQAKAIDFFMEFVNSVRCEHICIENPKGIISYTYRPADQVIHPWNFGDPISKETHLWLKNLPPLEVQTTEKPELDIIEYVNKKGETKRAPRLFYETRYLPAEERRKIRSKTFPGIAKAMAEQWSAHLMRQNENIAEC